MGLLENISSSIVKAMKNKNNDELESLRAIKSALLLVKTQKNSRGEIAEADEIKILQKFRQFFFFLFPFFFFFV